MPVPFYDRSASKSKGFCGDLSPVVSNRVEARRALGSRDFDGDCPRLIPGKYGADMRGVFAANLV